MRAAPPPNEASPAEQRTFWADRKWWKRTGIASIVLWAGTGFGVVATVVAARSLGPRDFGYVVLATAIVALIAGFLDFTLEEAVIHHGSTVIERNDSSSLRVILRAALLIDAGVGVVIFLLLIATAGVIAQISGAGIDPTLIRLAALAVLAATVDGTTGSVLLLAKRPDLRASIVAGTNFARLLFVILAVSLDGAKAVVLAYVIASLLGAGVQALVSWRMVQRLWPRVERISSVRQWTGRLASFGLHSSITTTVSSASESLSPILVGRLAGAADVGILGVALFPISLAGVMTAPLRMAIYPEQASLSAQNRRSDLRRSIRWHTRIGLAIGVLGAVPGWFLMPWLIRLLYGPDFTAAVTPARLLVIGGVLTLAFGWTKTVAPAIGKPAIRTALAATHLAVMVALIIILTGSYGVVGAAVAIVAAMALTSAIWWFVAEKLLSERVEEVEAN